MAAGSDITDSHHTTIATGGTAEATTIADGTPFEAVWVHNHSTSEELYVRLHNGSGSNPTDGGADGDHTVPQSSSRRFSQVHSVSTVGVVAATTATKYSIELER